MNPSVHFAQLLYKSFLPIQVKEWIIENIATISSDKLEEIYAMLQEEEARAQKILLQMEVEV